MRLVIDDLSRRLDGLAVTPAVVARIYNAAKPSAWAHALTGGDGIALLRDAITLLDPEAAVLRRSTGLSRDGDAEAFGHVLEHGGVVGAEGGSLSRCVAGVER